MIRSFFTIAAALLLFSGPLAAQQKITRDDSRAVSGFSIEQQDASGIRLAFSVTEFEMNDVTINGRSWKSVGLPGVFLPNNAGAPNLPGTGRYLAIPAGTTVQLEILDYQTELIQGVDIAPAPRIPKETEKEMVYPVDEAIYNSDAFYPAQPVAVSEPTKIRGVDVVMVGFTPFQYNPVSRELLVYRDISIKIHYAGGNGSYGDDRLRSRWFDPLLQDLLLNPQVLPEVSHQKQASNSEDVGFEYLIIVPNDPFFSQWADSIKLFRQRQGILTDIKTLDEVGGNTVAAIEGYLDNAYNTWDIPPVACLLIGDYGTNAANTIISPIWDSYCVSDNIFGDVDGNSMPDIVMARMTAQDAAQLEVMVRKFIDYERNPPTSSDFYNHPVTALGWQTERWFQICSEVIGGFWTHSLGKSPVRINEVYSGNPASDPWSTNSNTSIVLNYFGPGGLEYIPATPQALGGWTGGNAAMVTNALNEGSFMLQHRDHGEETGWGEPAYHNSDIDGLTNTDLTYIMSVNCLTGKYNWSSECFAEKFHRYTYNGQPAGALGILAASEVSYSFVNDAYIWGVYDNMWPEFMPAYGSTPAERGILPAFGNAAGKYFLEQSSWPYNPSNKEVTYNLFHHHGDAFMTVYSEVPQLLTVAHDPTIFTGVTAFNVTANPGSFICVSLNGEILGTATGTGSPVTITIPGTQLPPDHLDVVVTLQNYYRYEAQVPVIPPSGPYVVKNNIVLNDIAGNSNGMMEYGEDIQLNVEMKNVGVVQAANVNVTLGTTDPYVTLTNGMAAFGDIQPNGTASVSNAFSFTVADSIPNNHVVSFSLTATDGTETWMSYFSIKGYAPVLQYLQYSISDPSGNNNGKLDPGETVQISLVVKNTGMAETYNVNGMLSTTDPYVTINSNTAGFGNIVPATTAQASFSITADALTPAGHMAAFLIDLSADLGISGSGSLSTVIGQIPILIVDLDPDHSSGTVMNTTIQGLGLPADYQTGLPADLNLYSSIFVCLGIYSNNHVLTSSEGQALAAYLNQGGRLYMEGGDTWAYDSETQVHPMFKIDGVQDGSGDLSTLNGQSGTFTAGMNFSYSGGNSYIDRINPLAGTTAFKIFQNQSPSYGTGVAYDGGSYRTIGTSHEFSGLNNGSGISTKANLMTEYLIFFGILGDDPVAEFSAMPTLVCEGSAVQFTDLSTGNPTSWQWSFPGGNPAVSTSQNPLVTYAAAGTYAVTLIISTDTYSDTLTKQQYITVMASPALAPMASGPVSVCNNMPSSLITTVPVPGATAYNWYLLPLAAGSITGSGATATILWNQGYTGTATVTVAAVNMCGEGPISPDFNITLLPAPTVTQTPFSNVCINWPAFPLSGGSPAGGTYSGNGVSNGTFDPGALVPGTYLITYAYVDINGCSGSSTQPIYVDACTGLPVNGDDLSVSLYPNPAGDYLHVSFKGLRDQPLTCTVINTTGQLVGEYTLMPESGDALLEIRTGSFGAGVYMLQVWMNNTFRQYKFLVE